MLGSRKRGPDPAFPLCFHKNPASRTSVIAIPNFVFFPNPPSRVHLGASPFPGAVKSLIPLTFPESRTVFWSNPGVQENPSRSCFVQKDLAMSKSATVLARSTHRGYFSYAPLVETGQPFLRDYPSHVNVYLAVSFLSIILRP